MLPVPVLEVQYEETVADLPSVARRLVDWCGLEWEPACLAFHESKRPVRTASVFQVREPIHSKSVARWRHYEHDLGQLFTDLAPLLDRPSIEDQHAGHAEQQQVDTAKQNVGARQGKGQGSGAKGEQEHDRLRWAPDPAPAAGRWPVTPR